MQLTAASEGLSNVCPIQFLSAIIASIILRACKCANAEALPRQHLPATNLHSSLRLSLISFVSFNLQGLSCARTSRQMWRTDSYSSSTCWLSFCKVTNRAYLKAKMRYSAINYPVISKEICFYLNFVMYASWYTGLLTKRLDFKTQHNSMVPRVFDSTLGYPSCVVKAPTEESKGWCVI